MAITIEAVYENGVLKPLGALHLREHQQVKIGMVQKTPLSGNSTDFPRPVGTDWVTAVLSP